MLTGMPAKINKVLKRVGNIMLLLHIGINFKADKTDYELNVTVFIRDT